jgi:outer membrane receptor protein involved in Fe transport
MTHRSNRGLAAALVACSALIAPALSVAIMAAPDAAAAQSAPGGSSASTQVGEVVVTGTRIRGVTNATSAAPISVATAAQIQLLKATNVEEALVRMTGPDFTGGISAASNNGGDGLSEVGLRNLGPSRTLVLIDGQRLIPIYSFAVSVPDLNSVPLEMVDRIEVLRDGASSIYGADAIGGVINIITKKHENGASASTSSGISTHGDGLQYTFSGSIASNTDRSNVMIGLGWSHVDAVAQSDRGWAIAPHIGDPNFEGGSAWRYQLNLLQNEFTNDVWAHGVNFQQTDPALADQAPFLKYLPTQGFVTLNAGAPGWNTLTGMLDRKQVSFNGHYDLTNNIRFVAEGFFSNRNSQQLLRPEPILGDAIATVVNGVTVFPGFIVPSNAPGNTTGEDITAFLTPIQFGPRTYDQTSNTLRLRTGFEGDIGKWTWEFGYVEQDNWTDFNIANSGNWQHLGQMTQIYPCVDVPGGCKANDLPASDPHSLANGGPATIPAAMPNFFNGPYMFSPGQVAYLKFTSHEQSTSSERFAYADVNGPLFDLPAGPVKLAVGAEYRMEFLTDNPDALVSAGYAANTTQPTAGGYNVGSVYAELNIPVVTDVPFAKLFTLNPSVRWDDYTTFGSAVTYKIAANWSVSDDIRIRGSYNTGFRAPSTAELFGGQAITNLTASGDPCDTRPNVNGNANAGTGLTGAGSACAVALAGVPGAVFDGSGNLTFFASGNNAQPNAQQQVNIGGNPKLQPEKSSDWTIGGVITPRFLPGLSLTIDYYNIEITNTILSGGFVNNTNSPGPDLVLNGCYGPEQNAEFCSLIRRSPTSGSIILIDSLNANFGTEKVSGIDYELTFDTAAAHLNLPFAGSFHLDLQMSQLLNHTNQNPDGSTNVSQGTFQYAAEAIQPVWKGQLSLEYNRGPWVAHWGTRFLGSTKNIDGSPAVYGNETPNIFYQDFALSYTFDHIGFSHQVKLTAGVDNLLDQAPPFLGADSVCKCNTLAGPYDTVGRFVYGKLAATF